MIPPFCDGHNLPDGLHEASWGEVLRMFGEGAKRESLCSDLLRLALRAKDCGYLRVLIWGSFVTAKVDPGDLDLMFVVPRGVTKEAVSAECAELLDSANSRQRFGHDFYYCSDDPKVLEYFLSYLGYDNRLGKNRGLLSLDL